MRKLRFVAILSAFALALAGCGGGGDTSKFSDPGVPSPGGGGGTGATPAAITAMTSVPSIPSDGSVSATITALVRDASNNLLQGVAVTFQASSGGIAVVQATTDATGAAKATVSTAGDPTLRTITVTATAGSLQTTVPVQVVAGSSTSAVQMGSLVGSTFTPGQINISNATVSAGGSTSLSVVLQRTDGSLYTQATDVTFSSPCIANGTAAIQPQATINTATGNATATYVAKGCSGSDVITATATVGTNGTLSSSGTVNVAQAAIGSITFVSSTPTNIALKGTGDASRPESSVVVFKVLDASGGPRAGATVLFSLNTTVGGMTLTPATATATSDAQGLAQIVVNAGTVATSVKVTAVVQNTTPQISTQSSQLTVTTGIPTAKNMSLAVKCFNIEGWDIDGTQTDVTVRLADRFQNPVPDGTAVTFHAKGGKIGSQCTTTTTATESGVCLVKYTSQANRPADGRIPLLAMAIGEESFTDSNSNGAFDTGESFFDTEEPFEDDARTGTPATYQANDFFFDFNSNGTHDTGDLNFNGVLCNDPARCTAPKSVGIGARNEIILSGSTPVIDVLDSGGNPIASPTIHTASGATLWIRDVNGNPMPGGTTVAVTASTGFTVNAPSTYTVPCTTTGPGVKQNGTTIFAFGITATGTSGTFSITVTTPSGLATTQQFPLASP